jgi:succinoglycan biosynthesis protein ExoA
LTQHAKREPRLTLIIPARNELKRWPAFWEALGRQELQPNEIIVADGMSTDGSRAWLAERAGEEPRLRVLDNPAKIVPSALNVALTAARGNLVARMDLHADYPPSYLIRLVELLDTRPDVAGVGGAMLTRGRTRFGRASASVLASPVGMGGARHRVGGASGPVEHVFSGCYRREALLAIGGWDERLSANEDYEADVRIRMTQGLVWLEPLACSTWYVRDKPSGLVKQMFRYGHHKALTLRIHPSSLSARQLVPPAMVAVLLVGPLLSRRLTLGAGSAYLVATGVAGARLARSQGADPLLGAVVPALVHLPWGFGLLTGIARFASGRRPVVALSDRMTSAPHPYSA